MKKNHLLHIKLFLMVGFFATVMGCKKFIEIDPPIDSSSKALVFENESLAISTMTGLYATITTNPRLGGGSPSVNSSLSVQSGYLADELISFSDLFLYRNDLNTMPFDIWSTVYKDFIFPVNSIIEGLENTESLNSETRNILLGEAKFARSFAYFYLVNFYGDVPLVLTTNYKINSNIPRTDKKIVYKQIINDLNSADELLKDQYLDARLRISSIPERIRPNRGAVQALLARIYLYSEDWNRAEVAATKVLENSGLYELTPLNDVFLKNSREAIWQLQPNLLNNNGTNTSDALLYLTSTRFLAAASSFLMSSFESGDQRKSQWITNRTNLGTTYQVPYKYKVGRGNSTQEQSEYLMVLRLSEQYLIRAEARAHNNNLFGINSAESDLNMIRNRAGLSNFSGSTQKQILDAIYHERQVELFCEWGHRWLDLKRTGIIDSVMTEVAPVKGGTWAGYKALAPIPYYEFLYNPSLRGHQNPGYKEQI
ncbi:RagB/SusD family nutrient uptake outer membrane protein [Pedobacter faecalis]|uniref:RagB/SusD family nutrient uptake outer membrane protein n=1 Tax=Pedobacter faecalis TaxID=3041495 RepID=UPI00254EADAA|nr:RagB/SusD family nutrient uptake outer membrane protein [Pedobacter sp. ELA7]